MSTTLSKLVSYYSRLPFPARKPFLVRLVNLAERSRKGKHNLAIGVVSTPMGRVRLNLDLNAWLQREVFYHGHFEPHIQKHVHRLTRHGSTACDVGANIGVYTTQLSRLVGKTGRVIAFEPTDRFHGSLVKNLQINHCENVTVHKKILSDQHQELEIFISDQSASISLLPDAPIAERHLSSMLDDFKSQFQNLCVIKVDVDGWDFQVLKGGIQILKEKRPAIITECSRTDSARPFNIFDFLDDLNYGIYEESDISLKRRLNRSDYGEICEQYLSFNIVATPL